MSEHAAIHGYALVAASNVRGSKGCWETMDVPIVRDALQAWRLKYKQRLPSSGMLPLFLLGPSSGGFFATQYARHVGGVSALSIQVSVPSVHDVSPPLPAGPSRAFPPLQMLLMQRDSGKLDEAQKLLRTQPPWPGQSDATLLRFTPKPVTPTFFSDGIVGLSPLASRAARDALVNAGHVDAKSSRVLAHPSRGKWREPVLGALSRFGRDALPQRSLQVTMDAIFARLDLAYAYHASSCEFIDATISFFSTHSPAIKISRGGASIIRESRRGKASKGGRGSLVS